MTATTKPARFNVKWDSSGELSQLINKAEQTSEIAVSSMTIAANTI
jgi:hypothetical protein